MIHRGAPLLKIPCMIDQVYINPLSASLVVNGSLLSQFSKQLFQRSFTTIAWLSVCFTIVQCRHKVLLPPSISFFWAHWRKPCKKYKLIFFFNKSHISQIIQKFQNSKLCAKFTLISARFGDTEKK